MARALPIREMFLPFLLLTAAILTGCASGCASSPCRPSGEGSPPAAPSHLTAVLHPGGPLVLEWRDNSFDETSFVLIEDCGESRGRLVGTVGADQTRVALEAVAEEATCSFAVFAANEAGFSRPSNVATIRNASAGVPPGPARRGVT